MASLTKGTPTQLMTYAGPLTADSVYDISNCTAFDTQTAVSTCIEVICTFGAATAETVGAEVYIFGSVDGTNYSSKLIHTCEVLLEASATARQIFSIPAPCRYIKCSFKNTSDANITDITINAQSQTWA